LEGQEARLVVRRALAAALLAIDNASDLQDEAAALCVSAAAAAEAGAPAGDAAPAPSSDAAQVIVHLWICMYTWLK